MTLRVTHFPLHPETPPEGRTLAELFAGRGFDVDAAQARIAELAAREGLPYGHRTRTYNSRLAQELGTWAEEHPGGEAIHDALFRAYFVDGVNLARVDELVKIAASVGLSGDAARDVLEHRTRKARVDADWERSARMGVTAVPAFVFGGRGVVGAQSYETLEELLIRGGARRRV